MPTRLKLQLIFTLIFLLPGIAIVGYSMRLAANSIELTHAGVHKTGDIVNYERPSYQGRKARIGSSLCSVVQFSSNDKTYKFSDNWCSKSPKDYPPGSTIPIVFDPMSPTEAQIDMFWELYGASLASFLVGTPWLLIGLALIIRIR